jgi:hypothetical protein
MSTTRVVRRNDSTPVSPATVARLQTAARTEAADFGAAGRERPQALAAAFISFLYARTLSSEAASTMSATERNEPSSP